jgi:hypothetical protein
VWLSVENENAFFVVFEMGRVNLGEVCLATLKLISYKLLPGGFPSRGSHPSSVVKNMF